MFSCFIWVILISKLSLCCTSVTWLKTYWIVSRFIFIEDKSKLFSLSSNSFLTTIICLFIVLLLQNNTHHTVWWPCTAYISLSIQSEIWGVGGYVKVVDCKIFRASFWTGMSKARLHLSRLEKNVFAALEIQGELMDRKRHIVGI